MHGRDAGLDPHSKLADILACSFLVPSAAHQARLAALKLLAHCCIASGAFSDILSRGTQHARLAALKLRVHCCIASGAGGAAVKPCMHVKACMHVMAEHQWHAGDCKPRHAMDRHLCFAIMRLKSLNVGLYAACALFSQPLMRSQRIFCSVC